MELAEVSPHARDSPGSARDGVTGSTEPYGYEPSSVVGRWAALAFVGFLITLDVGEFLSNVGGLDLDLLNVLVGVPIPLTFVVVVASLHEITPPGQRLWTLLGLLFGTMWATVSVTAYFLQLTVVRYGVEQHREADVSLLSFGDLDRTSVGWSLNVLGWGVFLALALLVVAPALRGGGRRRLGRWSLRLSGI